MKTFFALILLAVPVFAEAQTAPAASLEVASRPSASQAPSDDSVKELLAVSGTQKMIVDAQEQVKDSVQASMDKLFAGKTKATAQQAMAEKAKMADVLGAEFNWDQMEDRILPIYRELFTQDEINELIAFYKGSAGKVFLEKMPIVVQRTTEITQRQLAPTLDKVEAIIKEAQTVAADGVATAPKIKSNFTKDANSGSLF